MRLTGVGTPEDREKAEAMGRVRLVASGILAGLTAIFVATHLVEAPGWGILLIRAMAEAGMIGGLADWFAVEALFRRPLGLPIPHTAILPSNQQRAATNVGRFFVTHFLDADELRPRILAMRPAHHAARWLAEGRNAFRAARFAVQALGLVLERAGPLRLDDGLRRELHRIVTEAAPDDQVAEEVARLLRTAMHGDLTDRLLILVHEAIGDNRDTVTALVQDRSRWWIASRVDRQVSDLLVDGVLSVIEELSTPGSALRLQFEGALDGAVGQLARDGSLTKVVTSGRQSFVETGAFDRLLDTLAASAQSRITDSLRDKPDDIAETLCGPLKHFAGKILTDDSFGRELDTKIAEVAGQAVAEAGPRIGAYVTDIIASWDSESLVARFETEVGRDLQFIRINGAVLGAMIGGAIFAVSQVLH